MWSTAPGSNGGASPSESGTLSRGYRMAQARVWVNAKRRAAFSSFSSAGARTVRMDRTDRMDRRARMDSRGRQAIMVEKTVQEATVVTAAPAARAAEAVTAESEVTVVQEPKLWAVRYTSVPIVVRR